MQENTGVNSTRKFTEATEEKTECKNIDSDIPLAMHGAKKNRGEENGWYKLKFFAQFTEQPPSKNKFFKDGSKNHQGDEGENSINANQVVRKTNILGLIDLEPGEIFEKLKQKV